MESETPLTVEPIRPLMQYTEIAICCRTGTWRRNCEEEKEKEKEKEPPSPSET